MSWWYDWGYDYTKKTKDKISKTLSGKSYDIIHGNNADTEKEKRSNAVKKYWESLTEEERSIRSNNQKGLRGKQKNPQMRIKCPHCDITGPISNMKRWHFEKCKNSLVNCILCSSEVTRDKINDQMFKRILEND